MAKNFLSVFAALALLVPAFAGAEPESGPGPKEGSYVLGPNDRITVRCLSADEFSPNPLRIDSDGRVTLPFIGRIKLAGMSVSEAEKELTDELSKFLLRPEVALNVVESHSQPVSVFGAVNSPGAYQLEGEKTLSEILSMAGGLRKDAGLTLKVTRRAEWGALPLPSAIQDETGKFSVADIDIDGLVRGNTPAANIEIRPYDVISVPQADLIYVVGQVRKPGGFTMTGRGGLTVLQAVSMAEGLDKFALAKKARILRKSADAGRSEIAVNLEGILAGSSPDLVLQADDVLFVPNSAAKSAGMKTLDTVIQLTTGMAIYGRF
jgi:polysaccharide biosynthesis/export protein